MQVWVCFTDYSTRKRIHESKCDFTAGLRDGGKHQKKRATVKVTLSTEKKI